LQYADLVVGSLVVFDKGDAQTTRMIVHRLVATYVFWVTLICPWAWLTAFLHHEYGVFTLFLASILLNGTSVLWLWMTRTEDVNRAGYRDQVVGHLFGIAAGLLAATFLLSSLFSVGPLDALFEATAGLTTTASTVLVGLDNFPASALLVRSYLQWIGGLGVIVFAISIAPRVLLTELTRSSLGPDAIVSGEIDVASFVRPRTIINLYAVLTVLSALTFYYLGVPQFDSLLLAMTLISTGGFSTSDAQLASFASPAVSLVAAGVMLLGATSWLLHLAVWRRFDFRVYGRSPELTLFLGLVVLFSAVSSLFLVALAQIPVQEAVWRSFVLVTSLITTTGIFVEDYPRLGPWATSLFLLSLIGGCSGSPSGGLKCARILLVFKYCWNVASWQPRVRYGRRALPPRVVEIVAFAFFLYVASFVLGVSLITALEVDFTTATSGTLASLTNTGVGFGDVIGPSGNYASLPKSVYPIFILLMLLGRAEHALILIFLSWRYWRFT